MATMTKLSTMTWPSSEAQDQPAVNGPRTTYIDDAFAGNTTDQLAAIKLSPTISTRKWVDQAAADAWKTFITNLATEAGTSVTVDITDII